MAREPIPTWFFVLCVVRKGDRFLLVQERKHGETWYFPAGRVEPGEPFEAAAIRETLEEAGVPVRLDGILGIEHLPRRQDTRLRVIFAAHPLDDRPPKSRPDRESLRAAWVSLEELHHYPLRGPEVRQLLQRVAAGLPVAPLSVLHLDAILWRRPTSSPALSLGDFQP